MATNLPGGLEYQTAHRSPASVPLPRYLPGSWGYAVGIPRASGSSLRLPGSLWSERWRERESSFKNKIMARRGGATWFTMRDGGREKVASRTRLWRGGRGLPGSLWSERWRERESSFKNKIMARREGATWFTMRDGGREKVISFKNKIIRATTTS